MKNLIGATAPTNRVLKSFKILMLIVLVAIGFTSCKDQSKKEVSSETELIAKSNLKHLESNFEIGGNQASPRRVCEIYSTNEIGGGKNSTGGLQLTSDIGGRGGKGTSSGTGQLTSITDIGGRSTSTTGNYVFNDIGGSRDHVIIRRTPIPFSSDIGGKSNSIGQ